MTLVFVIAIAVMAYLLAQTRRQLSDLERHVNERIGLLQRQHYERSLPEASGATAKTEPVSDPPKAQAAYRYAGPARIIVPDEAPMPATPDRTAARPLEPVPAAATLASPPDPAMHDGPWTSAPSPASTGSFDPDRQEPQHVSFLERLRPSGFEDLFGRKLPVWAGGVTLLVAAVLLIRYSIDAGLLSPWVRVMTGLIFGGVLIAGAELARRFADRVADPRVAQALAGAGLGALYAAILASHALYGLIGPASAFAGLTAVTGLAMGLAMRFGVPCAMLALVGGLATPALVQSAAPNVPLLAGYLAMIIGSLAVLSRRQRWFWLGASALAGGLGWSLVVILLGSLDRASIVALGLLVILLGLAFPALDERAHRAFLVRTAGAVIASLQLALLVSTAGYDVLSWGLYGLLSLGFLLVIERTPALRPFVAVPLLAALGLAAFWPQPPLETLAAVLIGIALIFGTGLLRQLWRDGAGPEQALHIGIASLGSYGILLWHVWPSGPSTDGALALAGLGFALLPCLGLAMAWRKEERHEDLRFPMLAGTAATLFALAAIVFAPAYLAPVCIGIMAAALLLFAIRAADGRIALTGLGFTIVATLALTASGDAYHEFMRLAGQPEPVNVARAIVRWGSTGFLWLAYAWHYRSAPLGRASGAACAALAYAIVAQVVPTPWLALSSALLLLVVAESCRARPALQPLDAALSAMALILFCWLAGPLLAWLQPALRSAMGEPMLVTALPALGSWTRGLLIPVLLASLAAWRMRGKVAGVPEGLPAFVTALLAGIALHGLYKHLFAIDDTDRFVLLGLAERTVWEACLIAAGMAAWHWRRERAGALALVSAGAAHALLYTIIIHNPLFDAQAVGPWPVVNLLLPSLGLLFALPAIIARIDQRLAERLARQADILRMVMMLAFGLMTLRQLAAGSVFAAQPVDQLESIGWSVLAIAMAVGWLIWGLRQQSRSWRIGSLLLMIAAVAKVFLIDASALTGILRILSFLALGFSLIGIGWLYSRSLGRSEK